ncbi:MAG TPA: NAD(P)H-hydrate epimerase, partial [Ignavibacteria bacterium]|nr:NAD(P)H-hydrate epimerase [Ignavibacteria bacterium]
MNEPLKYFVTQERIRIPAVTREQMTEIDRIAVQETGPNLFQMMENAGRNLAWLIITLIEPEWYEKEIVVLTGIGNNGGGGICAARHLVNHGGKVKLVLQNNRSLREIPSYQKMIYENAGGEILL